jgi:hypothetical protein
MLGESKCNHYPFIILSNYFSPQDQKYGYIFELKFWQKAFILAFDISLKAASLDFILLPFDLLYLP